MRHLSSLVPSSAFAAAVALFSSSAAAHIELIEPAPRYVLPANKSCPCGDGDSNRTCQVTAAESTDPNRSTNVTTFEAGSTITIVVEEYIDHAGRMRVAFDPDGADLADFNDDILLDIPDPDDRTITQANPYRWELEVTLPDMTCENCTLQVIQAMHGDTENPVLDPAPLSTYYTCADIQLVAQGTLEEGETGGSGEGGAANAGAAGAAGAGGAPAAAGNGGDNDSPAGAGGTAMGAAGADNAVSDDEGDGGCALRPGTAGSSGAWTLLLLGLAAARLRRR